MTPTPLLAHLLHRGHHILAQLLLELAGQPADVERLQLRQGGGRLGRDLQGRRAGAGKGAAERGGWLAAQV